MDVAYYRTLFEYERGANREVLRSLEDDASERALRLMAHLVSLALAGADRTGGAVVSRLAGVESRRVRAKARRD